MPRAKNAKSRMTPGMLSSEHDDWQTPDSLYDPIDSIFNFGYDAAASKLNTKCALYLNSTDDALQRYPHNLEARSWYEKIIEKYNRPEIYRDDLTASLKDVAWLNPPYGDWLPLFADMAREQTEYFGTITVMLAPNRSETEWYKRNVNGFEAFDAQISIIVRHAASFKVELYKRVKFTRPGKPSEKSQPTFPSILAIFGDHNLLLKNYDLYKLSAIGFVTDLEYMRSEIANRRRQKDGCSRDSATLNRGDGERSESALVKTGPEGSEEGDSEG